MESLQLDKSLVAQAQLSGQINDKNQMILEKTHLLLNRMADIQHQYEYHISNKRLVSLEDDIKSLSARIEALKNGSPKSSLFRSKSSQGVAQMHPIEYNQARDKVTERTF